MLNERPKPYGGEIKLHPLIVLLISKFQFFCSFLMVYVNNYDKLSINGQMMALENNFTSFSMLKKNLIDL